MSEDPSSKTPTSRSWLERLSHALLREPKDREQLLALLKDAEQRQLLDADALSMIEGVLEVSEIQVRDIMVPRSHMTILEINNSPSEFLPTIIESGHSRFPVLNESKDEVVGILFAKDLINVLFHTEDKHSIELKNILRAPNFVPEGKRVDGLLKEFRLNRNHMAIVVDEYGGIAGLVTIEDVLEEIVGEIEDEHDIAEDDCIKKQSDSRYTVKALTPIYEFNEYFKAELDEEAFDTIGGLIMHNLGHLPKRDETVTIDQYRFRVLHSDKRRIILLEMTLDLPSTDT